MEFFSEFYSHLIYFQFYSSPCEPFVRQKVRLFMLQHSRLMPWSFFGWATKGTMYWSSTPSNTLGPSVAFFIWFTNLPTCIYFLFCFWGTANWRESGKKLSKLCQRVNKNCWNFQNHPFTIILFQMLDLKELWTLRKFFVIQVNTLNVA